jgi:hypothetical protein
MVRQPQEAEELLQTVAWRRRQVDADPDDAVSTTAAVLLQDLAEDLDRNDLAPLFLQLRSVGNWLAESDAISDYADLAARYRVRIGVSEHPADGGDYLRALLAIAQSLI